MSWTTLQQLISALDSPWAGENVSNETRTIPQTSPYEIKLARIPKVRSTGTSILDNAYIDTTDMIAAGVSVTIGGFTATLTESDSPSAGEVHFQIMDTPYTYSPKMIFNAADKGKEVVANYTGYGANLAVQFLEPLQSAVSRLETYPDCALLSLNTYSGGWFDNSVADGTGLVILGARGYLHFSTSAYAFPTTTISLSSAGNTQVSAFSVHLSGWKRIAIWLIDNSGSVEARITESAESATQGGLADPSAYSGEAIPLGYCDVQGDGTGNAGGIEDVPQADIHREVRGLMSTFLQQQPLLKCTFSVVGALSAGTLDEEAEFPGIAGLPVKCTILNNDMGDDDTDLQIDILKDGSTSIFGTNPVIALGGGAATTQIASSSTFHATENTWDNDEYLVPVIDTVSANAKDLKIVLWYYPNEEV
jgi:hypothetical protein